MTAAAVAADATIGVTEPQTKRNGNRHDRIVFLPVGSAYLYLPGFILFAYIYIYKRIRVCIRILGKIVCTFWSTGWGGVGVQTDVCPSTLGVKP